MRETQQWPLILGLGLIATVTGAAVAKTKVAKPPDTSLIITIHVHNYAEVDRKTLTHAETVAAGIFRLAGIEARWIDAWDKQNPDWIEEGSSDLTHLTLNILQQAMADRIPLPNEVLGEAPGKGRERRIVYIFYNRIEAFAQKQIKAFRALGGGIETPPTPALILGYVIAHEIGHLLLNADSHSAAGIMRAHWESSALDDAHRGTLVFTSQQAEVIRAEVILRVGRRETREPPGLESPKLTR